MIEDKTATGEKNIAQIKDGTGEGPAAPVSATDPTGGKLKTAADMNTFMSNSELRPNKPASGTKSF